MNLPVHTKRFVAAMCHATCCSNLSPDMYTPSDLSSRSVAATCRLVCTDLKEHSIEKLGSPICLELLFGLSDENEQCVVKSFLYLPFLGEHWRRKAAKRPERVGQFVGDAVWSSRTSSDHGSPADKTRKGMVYHFNPNHRYLSYLQTDMEYRKIPKISPGAYIFQRPFLRGLFLEGLIYGRKFAFQNRLG